MTSSAGAAPASSPKQSPRRTFALIVGSGFSGLAMAIALKKAGFDDLVIVEKGDAVGGTWRDNTYPGCRCDVPSHLYSFSFAPNPDWSRTFSGQDEIWRYLRAVTEEHVDEWIGQRLLVSSRRDDIHRAGPGETGDDSGCCDVE